MSKKYCNNCYYNKADGMYEVRSAGFGAFIASEPLCNDCVKYLERDGLICNLLYKLEDEDEYEGESEGESECVSEDESDTYEDDFKED